MLGAGGRKTVVHNRRCWQLLQVRFLVHKVARVKIESLDALASVERHVNRAMFLKDLLVQRPGNAITVLELRDECVQAGIKCRKMDYLLEFYKSIFQTRVDSKKVEWVELGEDGHRLVELEKRLLADYEPLLVDNVRKLLMMSSSETISLKKIAACREVLGLPIDFEQDLVHRYPNFFEVVVRKDRMLGEAVPALKLTAWDPQLAVPRREADAESSERPPFSFQMTFPGRVSPRDQQFLNQFQALSFPSPYDPAHAFPSHSREAVKRSVAVAHEFLWLTQEKRAHVECLRMIRRDVGLPKAVHDLLFRYPGIFYLSRHFTLGRTPSPRAMVLLKEAYRDAQKRDPVKHAKLVHGGPMVELKRAFSRTMYALDRAYDRRHGTDSLASGRQLPTLPYDVFLASFQSDLYREQKLKYEGITVR